MKKPLKTVKIYGAPTNDYHSVSSDLYRETGEIVPSIILCYCFLREFLNEESNLGHINC